MIRFCDSNVGCAEYGFLNRSELLSYFLSGKLEEIVCVYDGSEAEEFVGIITYYSLLYALSMDSAIIRDYVILDQDVWKNAREIFKRRGMNNRRIIPLPVLDKDNNLVCFAYQDRDANREIRMLRELQETQGVLQFTDVFPAYRCVRIHEFNELAYFFAEYLRSQNVQVHVEGVMWQDFFTEEECQAPEFECLDIYAEGTWEKTCNWKENLLRSVSVEFECIDKIYEANINKNIIKDADCEYDVLLERLRGEKEVMLCGTDRKAQDTYDLLTVNGIEVCCFVVNVLGAGSMHRMFGKEIISLGEAMLTFKDPVFVECSSKHSAWGIGRTDYYDYMGYKRNERFIMLRDYVEVPDSNLLNALRNIDVVLAGEQYLCHRLYEYFKKKGISVTGYLHTVQDDTRSQNMLEASANVIRENTMCIIVVPGYYSLAAGRYVGEENKNQCVTFLRENNIDNFTDYFCDMVPFINVEKDNDIRYTGNCLLPKRVVLGSVAAYSGNIFFRSLLDSHPFILCMDSCDLNNQLFWICIRLSMERSENILPLFWKLIEGDAGRIFDQMAFNVKMEQLLARGNMFTSQELFIMFHIAYMYMLGMDVTEENISNMVIYWEPHWVERDKLEQCVQWLGTEEMPCDIINVVRNSVARKGSALKTPEGVITAYYTVLLDAFKEQKAYGENDRFIIKFEDLKCNPRENLESICNRWNIPWSDTLLQTTQRGEESVYSDNMQKVSGFDLGPVYNTYENFFSEFDRFRIVLMDAPWLKEYGYPYVEPDQFTRKELQEMFLKEFRFEKPGDTTGLYKDQLDLNDRIVLHDDLRRRLQEARCLLML